MQTLAHVLPSPSLRSNPPAHAPGDTRAQFARLARAHGPALHIRACRYVGDRSEAWDLVQDTFERALRAGLRHVPEEKTRAWLCVVMRNLFLDRLRSARRCPELPVTAEALQAIPNPEPEPQAPWRLVSDQSLAASMAALPAKFRTVYELRVVEGLGNAEIAARLGLPVATVATRLFRARQRLHEALRAELAASDEPADLEGVGDADLRQAVASAAGGAHLLSGWLSTGSA